LVEGILEAIPYDDWISGSEIAAQVGVGSPTVGYTITQRLLHVHVERKMIRPEMGKVYLYRRLIRLGGERDRHHNAVQNTQARTASRGEPR